jgi:AraC-like DNA-binding protein
MIESGSHTPGVRAADFRLPPGTALRYERPDPALAPFCPSYIVLASEPSPERTSEWMLPSWGMIWIALVGGRVAVSIGNREYASLPQAALYGVTSRAMPVSAEGGVTIGIELSPLGWARFIGKPAEAFRDRITPLGEVWPEAQVAELTSRLQASDQALDVKGILDGFLLRHLPAPTRDEPLIAAMQALIADDGTHDLVTASAALGVGGQTLRRLSKRHFGFPPKLLLIRTRFLKAFVPMLTERRFVDPTGQASGYHDLPHFIRDSRRFLGMPPRRFLALETPYLDAALRARHLVLGHPTPAIDGPAGVD